MTGEASNSTLCRKIGIKSGHRVALIGAPHGWSIENLPPRVRVVRRRSATPADVVVAFFHHAASLASSIVGLSESITPDGSLWIAWPRRAGGHESDMSDDVVRFAVLPLGLVDVKVAALDNDWSALKMVWRKELRSALKTD